MEPMTHLSEAFLKQDFGKSFVCGGCFTFYMNSRGSGHVYITKV